MSGSTKLQDELELRSQVLRHLSSAPSLVTLLDKARTLYDIFVLKSLQIATFIEEVARLMALFLGIVM